MKKSVYLLAALSLASSLALITIDQNHAASQSLPSQANANPSIEPPIEVNRLNLQELARFKFRIDEVFSVPGHGTVVNGEVLRGKIHQGDRVALLGKGKELSTTVTRISQDDSEVSVVQRNSGPVFLTLRGIQRSQAEKGMLLVLPDSMLVRKAIRAIVTMSKLDDTSFGTGKRRGSGWLLIHGMEYRVNWYLPKNTSFVLNLEASITLDLREAIGLEKNDTFSLRDGGELAGQGRIQEILF